MEAHQILVFMLSSAFLSGIAPVDAEINEVLPAEWSFWLDLSKKQKGLTKEEYLRGLKELAPFEDTIAFKSRWEEVSKQAGDARPPLAIHLFPRGITPSWEDPSNSTGGKYVLAVDDESPAALLKLFLTISVMLVCGKFAHDHHISGAVLSLRENNTHLVQLWTRTLPGRRQQEATRAHLAHLLKLGSQQEAEIRFAPHPTARKALPPPALPRAANHSPPVTRARSASAAPVPAVANPRVRSYAAALSGRTSPPVVELKPAEAEAAAVCTAPEAEPVAAAPAAVADAEADVVQEPVNIVDLIATTAFVPPFVEEARAATAPVEVPIVAAATVVAAATTAARESKKQKRRKLRAQKGSDSESASPVASDVELAAAVAVVATPAPVAVVVPQPAPVSAPASRSSWLSCAMLVPAIVAAGAVSAAVAFLV